MVELVQGPDAEARELARRLLAEARHAVLATIGDAGRPFASRIALGRAPGGGLLTLVSDLALHSAHMRARPEVALMVGEVGAKGDPLVWPRLTVEARALPVAADERPSLSQTWLAEHPKAALYIDFADFRFVRFDVHGGFLNAGFGKAFRLSPEDMGLRKQGDGSPAAGGDKNG